MRTNFGFATLLAGALLLSSPAVLAQQGRMQTQGEEQTKHQQQSKGQMGKQGTMHQLQGKVQKMSQTRPKGARAENIIVLLETTQGKHLAVDLGPRNDLKNVQLKEGTPLSVKGSLVSIKGKPFFLAQRVTVGQNKIQVQRQRPQQARQTPKVMRFSGQISQIRDVKVKGAADKHKLVLLKTQQGRQLYVDLGPTNNLRKMDLAKGDRISVQGFGTRIDNKAVLMAEQLQAGNQTVQVQRKALPPMEQLARVQQPQRQQRRQ